ncbi:MAG: hypothetical protein ACK48W_01375 [Bacteroidota bacterium]
MANKIHYSFFLSRNFTFCVCLIVYLIIFSQNSFSQTATEKRDENQRERTINGDRFKVVNNYVNIGIGIAQKFTSPSKFSFPVAAAYNFRVKKIYLQTGFMRSEMPVIWGTYTDNFINDLHLGICNRRENKKLNISYIAGPSLAFGLRNNVRFSHLGFYAEAHIIRKLFYDVGIGFCPFFSYNVKYPIGGIRLEFFFSSSYQGKINQ